MAGIVGRARSFEAFRDSVSLEDLLATARDALRSARVPVEIREETLSRLRRSSLTPVPSAAHLQLQAGLRIYAIVRFSWAAQV